jgi:hypothetical protein
MEPKYKSKMRQKQRERARANRAESKDGYSLQRATQRLLQPRMTCTFTNRQPDGSRRTVAATKLKTYSLEKCCSNRCFARCSVLVSTRPKESNKPKTTSAEGMRKLRERRRSETSGVASEPGVASTSRAAQAMDIETDSEQSTQSQTESTQDSTRSLFNSHNSTFVIYSFCYLCNKCILIHKTLISFYISTRIWTCSRKKASVVSKIIPTPFSRLQCLHWTFPGNGF